MAAEGHNGVLPRGRPVPWPGDPRDAAHRSVDRRRVGPGRAGQRSAARARPASLPPYPPLVISSPPDARSVTVRDEAPRRGNRTLTRVAPNEADLMAAMSAEVALLAAPAAGPGRSGCPNGCRPIPSPPNEARGSEVAGAAVNSHGIPAGRAEQPRSVTPRQRARGSKIWMVSSRACLRGGRRRAASWVGERQPPVLAESPVARLDRDVDGHRWHRALEAGCAPTVACGRMRTLVSHAGYRTRR